MKKVFFLLMGFSLGQGSMFLAQSYLIYQDKYEITSQSAIGLGFLSLAYWVVEMGGIFTFNKAFEKSPSEICNYLTARLIIGLCVSLISFICVKFLYIRDELLLGVVSIAPLIAVSTTISLLGYIDATQKNDRISHTSGLPWILSASCLLIPENLTTPYQHGVTIGLAFLTGQLIFTKLQYTCLRQEISHLNFKKVQADRVIQYIKYGLAYNLSFSSSQIYGRITPVLIDALIGAKISSIYIYIRNITNLFSQISIFAKRLEFSNLSHIKNHHLKTLLQAQKNSSSLTAASLITMVTLIGISHAADNLEFLPTEAWPILLLQITIYLLFNISGLYSQPLTAKGKILESGKIQAFQSAICILLAYPTLKLGGLSLMLLSEASILALGIYFYSNRLQLALKRE